MDASTLQKLGVKALDEALERLRKLHWERSASLLISWLTNRAKKRSSPDLPKKLEQFSKDIQRMCYEMRIESVKGAFVVKVNGAAEQTYKKLRLGTDWFEPCADLETIIMAGLDDQFGS